MSAALTQAPPNVEYTDLKPADVAFIQQTVPIDAKLNGFVATITTAPQQNGLMSVTIHYSASATPAAASAPIPAAPPARSPVGAQVRTVVAAPTTVPVGTPSGINFAAGGKPLQQVDFDQALSDLGNITAPTLWALLNQEGNTPPVGFMFDRRPKILFERHIFSAKTSGQYDVTYPDISGPPYTVYGTYAQQYARLSQAMSLNRDAALQSCSWGIAQVLGQNAAGIGFPDVTSMVQAMIVSEQAQLDACVKYILHTGSQTALANRNWRDFAASYNGTGNVAAYAASLETHYNTCCASPLPQLHVRAAQLMLAYLGHSLPIDGINGHLTAGAIRAFQTMAGIAPIDGVLTDSVYDAITRATFPG